jgi:hypothetical protein
MATLILYTRSGCCLCEGLEERLGELLPMARLTLAEPDSGAETVTLRLVDVDTDPALQARYGLSVPVLALAEGTGDAAITALPPVPPRLRGEPLRAWLRRHLSRAPFPEPPSAASQ